MGDNIFESHYQAKGIYSQRLYPSEALLCFLGGEGLLSGESNQHIKVLEVGCGSGANLWMMAKEGLQVYGMDSSPTSLRLAEHHLREKWNVDATLALGTFDNLPYEDGMFDYVIDVVSLQHIDLTVSQKALLEVHRVLNPKGKFFSYRLSDHSVMYEQHGCDEIDAATVSDIVTGMPLAGNGVISFWSPSLAKLKYHEAGLKIDGIERRSRCYQGGLHLVEYLAIVASKE